MRSGGGSLNEAGVASPNICRSALAIETDRGVGSLANTLGIGGAMRLAVRSDGWAPPSTSCPRRDTRMTGGESGESVEGGNPGPQSPAPRERAGRVGLRAWRIMQPVRGQFDRHLGVVRAAPHVHRATQWLGCRAVVCISDCEVRLEDAHEHVQERAVL